MKVTTERQENCQVKVFIEMDAADIDKELRQTARKLSRNYNIPGYRRGKAPYHAVMRVFGREAVQQQALEDFGQDLYDKALDEIEYKAYEVGELQDVEWEPFRMMVLIPIQPEVELGDYRAVRVPFEPEPVTDETIEERLHEYQQEHGQWVPVERPADLGDQVVLDFEGKVGDLLVMSNEGQEMILEAEADVPMPGFHEQVVGLSPGEEKTFTLTVPENDFFEEEVVGQEAAITVQVHTVREEDLPPLDDDLAQMVGDYDSLESLQAALREELETAARQEVESGYLDKVLDAMIEAAARIEYPPQAIDREINMAMNQMERNLAASGMQLDTFLQMIGKTRDAYRLELRPSAEERLKKRLVLNEIAEQEGLEADPEAIEAEIERLVEAMGENGQQMRAILDTPEGRQSLAEDQILDQAQNLVTQIGKGEAPEPEAPDTAESEDLAEPDDSAESDDSDAPDPVEPEPEAQAEAEPEEAGEAPAGEEPEAEKAD